jgi:DnaJ-class molecular chaperone
MPSDIVFVVTEKRHPRFVRRGDHLCYTHELHPNHALVGPIFNIPTLDGRTLTIDCRSGPPVGPGSKHKVVGEGMPTKLLQGPSSTSTSMVVSRPHRGDLLIDFNVIFPADPLSDEQKRSFMTPAVHS